MKIDIEYIWNNVNISSLIILKLFDDICLNCKSSSNKKLRVPIHYMCYDYGLLDCYLDNYNLALVFDKEIASSDLKKTTSNYYSFLDRLKDSDHYHSISVKEDLIIVFLKIPNNFHKDVDLIRQSKYSKTSKEFKDKMYMDYSIISGKRRVPDIKHPIAEYIVSKNIPAKIVYKTDRFIKELSKTLNLEVDGIQAIKNGEAYILWNKEREEWNFSKLKQYGRCINIQNNL